MRFREKNKAELCRKKPSKNGKNIRKRQRREFGVALRFLFGLYDNPTDDNVNRVVVIQPADEDTIAEKVCACKG